MTNGLLNRPDQFEAEQHYYPRVLNAHVHPLVRFFVGLGNERIAERYCHINPGVDRAAVGALLNTVPRFFRWGGADLFHTTDDSGRRRMVVIETNSCPSGQKSMPVLAEDREQGGYRRLLERSFLPMLSRRALPSGGLAVLSDKNPMETRGYARVLADLTGETVHHVSVPWTDPDAVRFEKGVLHVPVNGEWVPIRAAFRYVTQRPWTRIPPVTRTAMLNPVLACLAGGRNKLLASKAYDVFNARMRTSGLAIASPETIWDVTLREVPLWVDRMGGRAVVKDPYSNAGQGVWTITGAAELEAFMALDHRYGRFIVQALVANNEWSSYSQHGRLYHVGTVPDRHNNIYVYDLRCMVAASPTGFYPVALYARRARKPLSAAAPEADSWSMLGTNLSVKTGNDFTTEPERLLLMDARDFNKLGIGLDDFIEAYLQSVMAMTAIDEMASRLVTSKGHFRRKYFGSLNPDDALVREICQ